MTRNRTFAAFLVASCAFATPPAEAAVVQIASQSAFSALGTISQNTNWDSYPTNTFTGQLEPFAVGALSFDAQINIAIGGPPSPYFAPRNLIQDGMGGYMIANITGTYDLVGFVAGGLSQATTTTFTITTDVTQYQFNVAMARANSGLVFYGFQATGGEHITALRWSSPSSTGLTDIQLGVATPTSTPEPASMALLAAGLVGLGLARRREG